ncbi:hypothetical protein SS50377_22940 [Spironucleus salmonicida]|uniref:Uncharacterized protein n=1 Tax=Spironucleus salmonicida TaxID=348837 RepID=A0A9P8LW25_9EUKA|nr:hypothetical protein SS50377_22940 [Spironucleus salmonicida]
MKTRKLFLTKTPIQTSSLNIRNFSPEICKLIDFQRFSESEEEVTTQQLQKMIAGKRIIVKKLIKRMYNIESSMELIQIKIKTMKNTRARTMFQLQ